MASWRAVWRSASLDVDDSMNSRGPTSASPGELSGAEASAGASSTMACTLVPDIPNEDTATRFGV
ncbi:Uncharacterised protein [Mycobacterium tuberculosis]|uniref:Uncharacterized protein n=1 Tax=Mycobacterium tuberculosis TaxID=1773 RepID=A0A654U6J3_MYCTX|nr:Uncharacterised protein [Mycobacterium tuberculosis]CFE46308.1 Uncharacterised protein [Mycobacterium tuberculosis]CFS06144.1 Uncharacterised protein [Mycobacterium tuberculosis]CKQ06428.1 Uncharacterised protein [Mycobacterium tuberculosis]CKQ85192.1 Uncharacterised protein [Mycobacterium tuberculosis]